MGISMQSVPSSMQYMFLESFILPPRLWEMLLQCSASDSPPVGETKLVHFKLEVQLRVPEG